MADNETKADSTLLQEWADGKATLREVRAYSEEELYAIARAAHVYYHQGKYEHARTLFQGLYAVNPTDSYAAKALGVVELAAENFAGAVAAYDVAIKLNPEDASAYVGRAEVRIAMGEKDIAAEDLRRAMRCTEGEPLVKRRAEQMLEILAE